MRAHANYKMHHMRAHTHTHAHTHTSLSLSLSLYIYIYILPPCLQGIGRVGVFAFFFDLLFPGSVKVPSWQASVCSFARLLACFTFTLKFNEVLFLYYPMSFYVLIKYLFTLKINRCKLKGERWQVAINHITMDAHRLCNEANQRNTSLA